MTTLSRGLWGLFMTIAVAVVPAAAQKPSGRPDLRSFDAYVAKAMTDWKVPGMAIAIVRNDSIVFAKGYGVRKLGDPTPVDPHTVFAIGSSTKAFTSAVVAMLVDDGKMKWDAPITTYLPGFQLYDPYAAREVTDTWQTAHRAKTRLGCSAFQHSSQQNRRTCVNWTWNAETFCVRSQSD